MSDGAPFFPERVPIDAYGDGGFRFAGTSHRGSLLILPSGVHGWPVTELGEVTPESFEALFAESAGIDFLLFGTGSALMVPDAAVGAAFEKANIGLELMDTGAACRTYNVLLAEDRAFAAALIAVE